MQCRIKCFQHNSAESSEASNSQSIPEDSSRASDIVLGSFDNHTGGNGSSFLAKLGIVLGIAALITLVSVNLRLPNQGTFPGIQCLQDGSSSSNLASSAAAFSFRAFGYKVVLPEHAPGYMFLSRFHIPSLLAWTLFTMSVLILYFSISFHKLKQPFFQYQVSTNSESFKPLLIPCYRWVYFWLLMAAGCGLFVSEEALNIWVCPLCWYLCLTYLYVLKSAFTLHVFHFYHGITII